MSELFSFPIPLQVPGSVGAVAGSRVGGAIAKATARRAAHDTATASRTIGREEDGALSSPQVSMASEGASSGGAMQAEDGADARRGACPRPERRAGSAVAIPLEIVPELRWHLERFAEPGDSGYVFVGPKGGRPRRNNFRVVWAKACQDACISGVHFHDLRHTGAFDAAAQWSRGPRDSGRGGRWPGVRVEVTDRSW
jgi:hypothetical protein